MMGTSYFIMDIADRHVEWVELLVASVDGDGRLVCSEGDRHKHSSVHIWVCRQSIL